MFFLGGQVGSSLIKPKILSLWVYSIRKAEQSIKDWLMKVFDMSSCSITTAFISGLCSSAKERHYVSEVTNWAWNDAWVLPWLPAHGWMFNTPRWVKITAHVAFGEGCRSWCWRAISFSGLLSLEELFLLPFLSHHLNKRFLPLTFAPPVLTLKIQGDTDKNSTSGFQNIKSLPIIFPFCLDWTI